MFYMLFGSIPASGDLVYQKFHLSVSDGRTRHLIEMRQRISKRKTMFDKSKMKSLQHKAIAA